MPSSPIRMCLGCRQRAIKADLIRFVADDVGYLQLDDAQRLPGRGVYVHSDCLSRLRVAQLERALRCTLNPEQVQSELARRKVL